MDKWIKVMTHPLGFAGFALWLAFLFASKSRKFDKSLTSYAFIAMALILLVGGLGLAYWQTTRQFSPYQTQGRPVSSKQAERNTPQASIIKQKTEGPNSPAVVGSSGDVNITINREDPAENKK